MDKWRTRADESRWRCVKELQNDRPWICVEYIFRIEAEMDDWEYIGQVNMGDESQEVAEHIVRLHNHLLESP